MERVGLRHYYDLLGVPENARPAEVRRAYLKAIKKVHPDLFPSGSQAQTVATEKTREINDAYARIRHAPLRFVSGRGAASPGEKASSGDDISIPSAPRPTLFDRWQLAFEKIPFTVGRTRKLSYLYLSTTVVNSILAIAALRWELIGPSGVRNNPYLYLPLIAVGLPFHTLDLVDRMRKADADPPESMLGEFFAWFSSAVFFAYPFLCFVFGFSMLLRGQVLAALWFGICIAIVLTLQRRLSREDSSRSWW